MSINHVQSKNFTQWINFALSGVDKVKLDGSPAACVALSLNHVNGTMEKEIHGVQLGGKKYDDAGVVALADMLKGLAETDAQNLPGVQQYVVYAFYEGSEKQPQGRFILRINGHLVNKPGDLSTEPATVEGRLQQRMRHDEAYSQMLVTTLANTINQQNAFIHLQAQRLNETTRENRDMFETTYRLLLEKATGDREHELRVLEYERNTKLMAGLAKVAPAMANTITGRKIFPESTVDTAIIETIADVLDEETIAQLGPVLAKVPPEMQGVLMSRLEQIIKAKQEAQTRVDKVLNTHSAESIARAELTGGMDDESATH